MENALIQVVVRQSNVPIKKARAERAKQLVLQINYAELGHTCWPALLFVSFELEGGRRRWHTRVL